MDPNARRRPVPESWVRPAASGESALRRRARALVLGTLVVLTVWGFGRSGFPGHARWFLLAGLAAGTVTAVVSGRRARR